MWERCGNQPGKIQTVDQARPDNGRGCQSNVSVKVVLGDLENDGEEVGGSE